MEGISDEVKAELVRLVSEDIVEFSRLVCDDVVTGEIPDFHYELYDLVVSEEKVAVAAPRGFAKSTLIAKVYPFWLALSKRRRDIVIISSSEGLAVEHLRYIKTSVESSEVVKQVWGELRSEKWTENHIIIHHIDGTRVNIRAKGASDRDWETSLFAT